MWLALLPGNLKKKNANALPQKRWKRKWPSIKKVTKFPHCINQFQYSKRRGWGEGKGYVQGPIENAVVGLWHYEQFPPSLSGGILRAPEFLWPPGTAEALPLRVLLRWPTAVRGRAFFFLQRQSISFVSAEVQTSALSGLAGLCRGAVRVGVCSLYCAFCYSLTPATPLL